MKTSMQRKRIWLVLAALLALAAGVAAFVGTRGTRSAPPAAEAPAQAAGPSDAILSGIVQARETVKVPAPVDGAIQAFHVEVGAPVYEGELLAEIKNADDENAAKAAEGELERAQQRVNNVESMLAAARLEASRAAADAARVRADLERSSKIYQRQKLLLAEGATPRLVAEKAEKEFRALELDSAQLAEAARHAEERVDSYQKELDAARKLLEHRTEILENAATKVAAGQVLSPANGVVAARRGQVGENVDPSMEDLFVIATELSQLEVTASAPPNLAAAIQPGMPAAVFVADLPSESLPGAVKAAENGKVVVEFANPSPLVKPGQTAQVRIKVK